MAWRARSITLSSECSTAMMLVPVRIAPTSKPSWSGCAVGKLSFGVGLSGRAAQQLAPSLSVEGDPVVDGSCASSELGGGRREERPPGTRGARRMRVPVAEGEQQRAAGRRRQRRRDDLLDKALPPGIDGGQLELLLGAEQGIEAALGHACRGWRAVRSRGPRDLRRSRARPPARARGRERARLGRAGVGAGCRGPVVGGAAI